MAYCILPSSTISRLSLPPSPSQASFRASISRPKFTQSAKCMAIATPTDDQTIVRRVGNYHPPIWEYDYVQSLTSKYQVYSKFFHYFFQSCQYIDQNQFICVVFSCQSFVITKTNNFFNYCKVKTIFKYVSLL